MKKTSRFIYLMACTVLMLSLVLASCGTVATPAASVAATAVATATAAPASTVAATTAPATTAPSAPAMDTSKAVVLSTYLIGGPAKDYDMVLAEFNKKAKADLNATMTVNWIGWADFTTKYPLVLASGEPIDLIYASTWTNFYANAQKGAFMAIEDLAPVYAPKSFAKYDPAWLKQATVNGHLYAFPANFSQVGMMGYIVRGDFMTKYNIPDIRNMDDYGVYLDAIVKNEKGILPSCFVGTSDGLDTYFVAQEHHYVLLSKPFFYDIDTGKVINMNDMPDMPGFFAKMKEWSDKGYWPKSVLSNKDDQQLQEGLAASRLHNQDTWNTAYVKHPEWDLRFFWGQDWGLSTVAMQDGMAIPGSAANPERALMLLEKLKTDEAYYDLLTYGIRGVHYEVTADNLIKPLNPDAFAPEGYCSWGFKQPEFYKPLVGSPPTLTKVKEELKSIAIKNPYELFTVNLDPIKNEIAAMADVMAQYETPLAFGLVADPVAGLAVLKDKQKAAGADKALVELQKQLDEFKAANP